MGSRETPLLKKPPLILLLHILLPSKAPLLRQVSNWFDKTPSSLISRRWQRRRLTLILPTQRWERQPPKFSPASKLEWLENLQKRPQKKVLLPQQRWKKLQKRQKLRRRWILTWKTQR